MCIRVVNVKGLRTREGRAAVCYVGRAFAGWPNSGFGNPFKPRSGFDALAAYREHLVKLEADDPESFAGWLRMLWDATGHGAKPLGCWCTDATAGDGSPVVCHAQILAGMLAERFGEQAVVNEGDAS
jgi:hypothetical protein